MKLFDLHCDTIGECYKNKLSLRRSVLNVSLDKAKEIEAAQAVAAPKEDTTTNEVINEPVAPSGDDNSGSVTPTPTPEPTPAPPVPDCDNCEHKRRADRFKH